MGFSSLQNAYVSWAWCVYNSVFLFLDSAVFHPPISLNSILHTLAYLIPSIILLRKPQLAEVCPRTLPYVMHAWAMCCRFESIC